MKFFTIQRWSELLEKTAMGRDVKESFCELVRRYSESHRHYHNARHIDECLEEFDRVRGEAQDPIALELAIWFHDVIYNPRANDNEERSAEVAEEWLKETPTEVTVQVRDLILTTKTHSPGEVADATLLIDIDLSIFGKPTERFAEFESGIRSEYAWVPPDVYCSKRAEILAGFLNRERIYRTDSFRDRYESNARRNVGELITRLLRRGL